MSSFSHCPKCQQPIAIPDGADPAARVRCPHCQAEFSLSDAWADRADGPPDVILVTPPPAEAPLPAGPSAETAPVEAPLSAGPPAETALVEPPLSAVPPTEAMPAAAMDQSAPAGPPTIEASPEAAQLDQEVMELAEEASWLQSQAEGLQVTAHTSNPEPEAAAAQAEDLESEADALATKVEAIADPLEALDAPTARPATVAGTYRAMGGALIATAEALDAVAEVIQHKVVATQPKKPEETPVAGLESDLAAALAVGEHHDEKPGDDEPIPLELPEPILGDEAPLPMSDGELFLTDLEPAGTEPATTEPATTESGTTEPAATEPDVVELSATEPPVTEVHAAEPVGVAPAAPAESPAAGADSLLLKAVNLRSKAEALRSRGQGLLAKADALRVAAGVSDADFEASEGGLEGEEGEYAFHGDWDAAGSGTAAGATAAAAAAGGMAMPFATTPRKEKKPKSALRELVAVVLGGVTAFVLTYLILNLVSAQYDWFGICPKWFPHIMKSETTGQTAPDKSSKVSKDAKPGQPKAANSPAGAGQGTQVAQAGAEKHAAGKTASSEDLPAFKPAPRDSAPSDAGPTTLAPDDTAPGAMVSPLKPEGPKTEQGLPPAPKAEEPKTEEKPAESETQPPPADAKFGKVVDLHKLPGYGSSDLGWALTNAKNAFQGDLKPEVYTQLCHLAEVLTFVDPQKGVTGLPEQKAAVEKLLRDVGERDKYKNVKVIAQLADKWLDNPEREYPGILLAGRVQTILKTTQGRPIAVIALAKPDKNAPAERTIKMVSQGPLDLQEKDAVVILGGLGVGGPSDHRELIVVHGMTVKFARPPAKPK